MIANSKFTVQRRRRNTVVRVIILLCILAGITVFLTLQKAVPVSELTRDPIAVADLPFYVGMFSNIGLLFWAAAVAIHLFSAYALSKTTKDKFIIRFMLASAFFTVVLLVDDMLLFHDRVFPEYLHISEYYLFAGYGVFLIFYVTYFRKIIFSSDSLLMLAAVVCFGGSLGLDFISDIIGHSGNAAAAHEIVNQISSGNIVANLRYLAEDGAKLMGIILWTLYSTQFCLKHIGVLNTVNQSSDTILTAE